MSQPLTEASKALHKEYAACLVGRGFVKMDDPTSRQTELYNHLSGDRFPVSFLLNDFYAQVGTNRDCEAPSNGYLLRHLPHIGGFKFEPSNAHKIIRDGATGVQYLNKFRKYAPTSNSADVSPLLPELFERLFPDVSERTIALQWLAHIFQRPGERPSWHLMLVSETGTGKGFLVEKILHPLLNHTSVISSYSRITGKFSGVLAENMLALIDDAKARSEATQTELKSLLSEGRVFIERKFGGEGMQPTYCRIILASNEDRPLRLEANERRWFIPARIDHRKDREDTQQFIERLSYWLDEPESLSKVYNWFMAVSLDGFNPKHVPPSAGLDAIVKLSADPCLEAIHEWAGESGQVFTYADVVQGLKELGITKPGDRELGHKLREAGFVKRKIRPTVGGKQMHLFGPSAMGDEEWKAIYAKKSEF